MKRADEVGFEDCFDLVILLLELLGQILLCCPSLLAGGFLTATHSGTPGGTIFDINHIAIYI